MLFISRGVGVFGFDQLCTFEQKVYAKEEITMNQKQIKNPLFKLEISLFVISANFV